jgi:hypothetical protein
MAERAAALARGVEAMNGVRLSFDLVSLGELDGMLAEWIDMASVYDSPEALSVEQFADPIASYVGEVLVQSLDAEWIFPSPTDDFFPKIRLKSGQRIDLYDAVIAVLRRGAPPAFRQLARLSLTQARDEGETPDDDALSIAPRPDD